MDSVIEDGFLEENVINNGREKACSQNFETLCSNPDSRSFRVPETVMFLLACP